MLQLSLAGLAALVAYSNGANDNFKGVASLYASRTTGYGTALAWGTGATLAGSLASVFLAQGLIAAFSGKGIVPTEVAGGTAFLLSVSAGAGGTVLLATRLGFPISTTHSLVGGIAGAGAAVAGSSLRFAALVKTVVLPLLLSPFLAMLLAIVLYRIVWAARARLVLWPVRDLALDGAQPAVIPSGVPAAMATVDLATPDRANGRRPGVEGSVDPDGLSDVAHFLSAGLVSFARGLNDTPKIAALLLPVELLGMNGGLVAVGLGMALGGLLGARRVAVTLGDRITSLDRSQGLAANLATGALVIWASGLGLPVSTTHVSVGALFGIGASTGQADFRVMRAVAASWVLTLPCAAALSAAVMLMV